MKESDPKTWEQEARQEAGYAFKKVSQLILSETRIVVSTKNNLASDLLRQHFGKNARGIILFRDEDPKELIPSTLREWLSGQRVPIVQQLTQTSFLPSSLQP